MSSWYRNLVITLLGAGSLGCAEVTLAQQWYWQPQAEIGVEGDTNRNMVTSSETTLLKKKADVGYDVNASALIGYSTPTSDTVLKPLVVYDDYPSFSSNDYRANLDLNSQLRTSRGQGQMEGTFDRQATYSAELANPLFNQVTPDLTTPATGRINNSTIRTFVTAAPTYTFDLTQRLNWGIKGTYQDVQYSGSDSASYVPFDYYWGNTTLGYAFDQRLTGNFGAFASHEASRDSSGQVNAYGVDAELDYKLSSRFTQRLALSAERDYSDLRKRSQVTTVIPDSQIVSSFIYGSLIKSTDTGIGATYSTTWVGQIQKVEASVGRTYQPTGNGGTYSADQFQLEYTRDLSPRLQLTTAALYLNEKSVSSIYAGSDYLYVNATAGLKWKLTPTWYVGGGVTYLYEHFQAPVGNAHNGVLYVSVGYLGLGKPGASYLETYPYQQTL